LADRLGKFLHEVDALPVEEFDGWIAYFMVDEESRSKRNGR